MAGDWIKLRTDLQDDPEVLRLSSMLKIDRFAVVGRLAVLWAWADKHTTDGNAVGVTQTLLDSLVARDGFADAMVVVGWLMVSDRGVTFPNFDNHNGETAKKRALTARRQSRFKSRSGNASVTLDALPREEKRREEKQDAASDDAPVWNEVLTLLASQGVKERAARGFVGLLRRDYEDSQIVDAAKASVGKVDFMAYMRACLKGQPKKGELERKRLAV